MVELHLACVKTQVQFSAAAESIFWIIPGHTGVQEFLSYCTVTSTLLVLESV